MRRIRTHVEFVYLDILKHKIRIFRENGKTYFKLPEDNKYCRRDINTVPDISYLNFIKKLVS